MIIMGLLTIIEDILLSIVSLFPDEYPTVIDTAISTITTYISQGAKILLFYFDTGVLGMALSFALDFILIIYTIKLVKYIIKVIPILNIDTDSTK